jgi:hypothetical protein
LKKKSEKNEERGEKKEKEISEREREREKKCVFLCVCEREGYECVKEKDNVYERDMNVLKKKTMCV